MVRKINGRTITPLDHKAQHQTGGEDEINVNGLKGRLADMQNADTIKGKAVNLTGIGANKILQYDGEKFVVGNKADTPVAGTIASNEFWVAKGDVAVGTSSGNGQRLAVGTDPWMQLHPNPAKAPGVEWRRPLPSFLNRVFRLKDAASTPNDLEIHAVYIPQFKSKYFTQPGLNDIDCGGFWVDKFQACQPLASNVSRGGLTPNSPGAGVGAACKPHVVPWTDVSWDTAKAAIENRGGSSNLSNGGTPTACGELATATNAKAEFLVANVEHLVGRHIEIAQNGVTYHRRIVKTGLADQPKYVKIHPALPQDITAADTYVIKGWHLITPHEEFSLAAWARRYRYEFGLGYPAGNNDWGKDVGDPRAPEYEGISDLVRGGYDNHEKSRCLTGSGPLSWSLNEQENGVWDLNGNVWEWTLQQLVGTGTGVRIKEGFPGEGTIIDLTGLSSGGQITEMYAAGNVADGLSVNSEIFYPVKSATSGLAEYGNDGWWFASDDGTTYAARRGGYWNDGAPGGVFAVVSSDSPSGVNYGFGFRGAC